LISGCDAPATAGEDFVRRWRRRRPGEEATQGDGIVDRLEGGAGRVADRQAASLKDGENGVSQGLLLPLLTSFATDLVQIPIALALEQIAEGDGVSGLAVVERFHRHGVLKDSRRGELLARTDEARLLPAFVDLDPARSGEADDPDHPGAGGKAVVGVRPGAASRVLKALRGHPLGRNAEIVGVCLAGPAGALLLDTGFGRRLLAEPEGEPLPRIC
jgi:hydrogenase expression/formation protein HypE